MNPRQDTGHGWMFVGLALSVMVVVLGLTSVTRIIGAAAIPIWIVTAAAGVLILRGPLGKALAARLGGGTDPVDATIDVPEEVYAELDELRARMIEMEERQDFAERLLAARSAAAGDSSAPEG